jgi:hypothetical protein
VSLKLERNPRAELRGLHFRYRVDEARVRVLRFFGSSLLVVSVRVGGTKFHDQAASALEVSDPSLVGWSFQDTFATIFVLCQLPIQWESLLQRRAGIPKLQEGKVGGCFGRSSARQSAPCGWDSLNQRYDAWIRSLYDLIACQLGPGLEPTSAMLVTLAPFISQVTV